VTAGGAILGVAPREAHEPPSLDAFTDTIRGACARKLAIAVVGGRTEIDLGAPPSRLDAVVSTRRLDRVVDHAPADQIVVVEAGVTVAKLQATLAAARQRLAFDPPLADRATIGGLLATNAFGPLRARYGSLKDLVIGASFVGADGRLARGGGRVVKNVAGFDLPKLLVGSLGTLGAIATLTFRVHPLPEAHRTVRFPPLAPAGARAVVVKLRDAQLEPAAVAAWGSIGALALSVRFEGFAAGVDEQARGALDVARDARLAADLVTHDEARRLWADHDEARTAGDVRVKIAARPGALAAALAEDAAPLAAALDAPRVVAYPTLGTALLSGRAGEGAEAGASIAPLALEARARIARRGGSLVIHALPLALRGAIDVWGAPSSQLELTRRTKRSFDPDGRMNPGRFVYGL